MEDKMMFIDPHVHMSSRTTDDYEAMAKAGIVALIEPSFWLGQPRTKVGSFQDYYSSLVGWEPFRASQFGIQHYCTIGLNSKEANNEALAEQVIELLPLYVHKENVVAIGEIGYDDQTAAEDKYFRIQLELAKELNMVVQVHTPHRDKKAGTIKSMEVCLEHGLDPSRVIIDHNNEETVEEVLNRGFIAAFTIYPNTKMGNERMVEVVKKYGSKDIIVDSSADWGVSDPLAVPKTAALMLKSGIAKEHVIKTCYQNALDAFGENGKMKESDWMNAKGVNQTELFNNNSVLRGQDPKIENTDKIH
ncbi:TatD family hydrolase [Aurantibacter crassamenti]|uniref:TatD family hydrolase n=1 Tax=Aurantibacter crassamenti TaxID=1837375 RepID=UPI001939B814|nr:TatD family hydrolase [Aurantibacter crassamenti]MBM1107854.1 TatD family hydrolase [Aurantibacter crassamenti]